MEIFDVLFAIVVVFLSILLIVFLWKKLFRSVIIYEYEQGLKFYKGKLQVVLNPGMYRYFVPSTSLEVFDMRPSLLQLNGQELLTSDNISVKISMTLTYQLQDPQELVRDYQNFKEFLYTKVQFKLREVTSSMELDELLANRKTINLLVQNLLVEDTTIHGISILSVDIKDIMLAAEMKKLFTEVMKAKKEAQAKLEKARGEAATMRSLANTAKMLENNPELAKLRLIQTIEASEGNSFIIDISGNDVKKGRVPTTKQ